MQWSRRAGEMETISGSLRVLLLCPLLARALYVRDAAGPAAAYVADYHRKMPAHKTYYISNTNLNNMKLVNERAVDSYFRILRATPQAYSAAAGRHRSSPLDARATAVTEPPPPPRHRHSAENTAHVPRNDPRGDSDKTTPLNQSTQREHDELFKPSRNEYFRGHSVYEKNAAVSKGDRGNRRPHRAQNFHQKMYLSQQVRDKVLRGADASGDRGGRPARLLVDSAQTVVDKNVHSAKEYRKRNTIDKETGSQRMYEQNDNRLQSPGQGGAGALFHRTRWELDAPPPDARAALEEAADGAYYRGSASSFVRLNVGRKHAPLL